MDGFAFNVHQHKINRGQLTSVSMLGDGQQLQRIVLSDHADVATAAVAPASLPKTIAQIAHLFDVAGIVV
jgi:hypothetical protein